MRTAIPMLLLSCLMVTGCTYSPEAPREPQRQAFVEYLFSLYGNEHRAGAGGTGALRVPGRVVVAEFGEIAPPAEMIREMRKEAVFSRVDPMPGLPGQMGGRSHKDLDAGIREEVGRMRRMAADMGADYLVLVGSMVDALNSPTPLAPLDATLVGAFVSAGNKTRVSARASAAMVDVRSGRVVLISSVDSLHSKWTSAASGDAESLKMQEKLRKEMAVNLARQLGEDCRNVPAMAAGAAGNGAIILDDVPVAPAMPRGGEDFHVPPPARAGPAREEPAGPAPAPRERAFWER